MVVTSSATRQGLGELAAEIDRRIPPSHRDHAGEDRSTSPDGREPAGPAPDELAAHRVFRPAAERAYRVERVAPGSYRVIGRGIERLVARYDPDNEEAMAHLERRLRGIGVIDALEAEGFEAGDEVEIAGVAFELDPEV